MENIPVVLLINAGAPSTMPIVINFWDDWELIDNMKIWKLLILISMFISYILITAHSIQSGLSLAGITCT